MTRAVMFLGTHSNAGKSWIATAFCRILARKGYRVAPFKAQNMSNNAGVTRAGGEMGRSQIVQAEAAGVPPHTDMNPVLLKPEGRGRSQIVLNGRVYGHMEAHNWMDLKPVLWREIQAAYRRLAERFEVVVLEGAGSPAEINLKAGDLVNLRMAQYAGAAALLIGDIDRGGVFAALAGTMLLLEPQERQLIQGFLINKFRGDPAHLGDGLDLLREKAYGVPTLGVIPFVEGVGLPEEDAVALESPSTGGEGQVDIAVIHLPHIANFDEFDALAAAEDVRLRYVRRPEELGQPSALILPGTKATLADLDWIRRQELDRAIAALDQGGVEIVGICGGFQILGRTLSDPEGVEEAPGTQAPGLGLLPLSTCFYANKQTHQARIRLGDGEVLEGYEIHTGQTALGEGARPFGEIFERSGRAVQLEDGAIRADGRVWGTYLHGLFANQGFRQSWLHKLGQQESALGKPAERESAYERLADEVEAAIDWPAFARITGLI